MYRQPAAPVPNGSLTSSTNSKGKQPEEPKPKPVNNWRSTRNQKQSYHKAPYSRTSWLKDNTGKCVHTIAPGTVQPCATDVSSEDGFVVLCSYNWQLPEQRRGAKEQVICVPGAPPKWSPLPIGTALQKDTGPQFVDQNAYNVPKYPFEPAFRALAIMSPNVQLDDIDIVANRNSFRKFLDFVAGRRQDPFRMDMHMVNNTLFITRRERSARIMISGPHNSTGYGHDFEKKFTTPIEGLNESSSHHRVIRYMMGDLNCAVRYEVDAQYDDTETPEEIIPKQDDVDALIDAASQLTIKASETDRESQSQQSKLTEHHASAHESSFHHNNEIKAEPLKKGDTRVIVKGINVPASKLTEIKAKKHAPLGQCMPQLWFGRTPHLIVAKHTDGVVHKIEYTNAGERFKDWEKENQENLRKLVNLLAILRDMVKDMDTNDAVLVCETKGGGLELLQNNRVAGVLPKEIINKHWSGV